ncbi:MAG: HK97 gp10 family phage protein [Clostridia bacterium]|nr:HK97 gp10 family phage protein [Clostridia bacterium]
MARKVSVNDLADAVTRELDDYADTTTDGVKAAVKKAANTVKKEIAAGAPENTGRYAKSWRTKTTGESAASLEITVYSPSRYMLAHLLEHGHAKRNGGRVAAKVHIAPAEQDGEKELKTEIGRKLRRG